MADDVRRWSVTYTKHNQKRKVYLDGCLELQSSSHKVKLYDDCGKLLDSRIVKLNDAVRSGETLTFGAFLVDIGDPHGESKPISNPIIQRDKTMADRDGKLNSRTSKGSLHVGKRSSINLSPSHKFIREFKRREVNKYCSSPNVQDTVKADSTEWEVLYTAQLTQKAKKFHDGILKVANSGLTGRQAFLYDGTRKLLECRFLRNEEKIKVGESLRFDGHIIDILEPKDNKTQKDTHVDRSNCDTQSTVQSKIHDEHLADFKIREANKSSISASCPYTTKTNSTEWDVMYTTQVTQKAKKFHDGVLKLASSGSQGRQEATLLAEDGTVLSHRYLKLLEDINSGSLFNMTNYLVEVGEPRKHSEGECPRNACTGESETPDIRSCNVDSIKLCKRIPATRPLSDEKPPKTLQDIELKTKKSVADKVIPTTISKNKTFCDEWDVMYTTQITQKAKKYHDGVLKLSSCGSLGRQEATLFADDGMILSQRYLKLSEEISCGSSFNMTIYLVEVGEPRKLYEEGCPKKTSPSESETPETTTFDVDDMKLCKTMPTTKLLSDGNTKKRAPPLQDTDSKVKNSIADNISATTISKFKPLRDAHSILSFLNKPSAQDGAMSKVNGKEIQPSQDSAFVQSGVQYQVEGHPDSCSKRSEEAVRNEETQAANVGGHPEAMSSEATSTSSFNGLAKKTKDQSDTEISGDNRMIDSSVHDVSIDPGKGSKETNSRNDEFPSFDLGID